MKRNKTSLDSYEIMPKEMSAYLSNYGKHFSKRMYEWAVSMMYKSDGGRITPLSKQDFQNKLNQYGIKLENDTMYDGMYVYSMAQADFYGSTLTNEQQLMRFVKDYVDDPDAVDGFIFNRFYADCCLKGEPIDWIGLM